MSAPPSTDTPQNPLDRFTSGGWVKGVLRFGVGVALVAVVLNFAGKDSWQHLDDPRLLPVVLAGALAHIAQRLARIRKWQIMLRPTPVEQRSFAYLFRIQLIGMVANLALPVSEALKVWSVSKSRAQVKVAAKSIVIDMAIHTTLIGAVGLGSLAVLFAWQRHALHPAVGAVGAVMLVAPLLVMAFARRWPTEEPKERRVVDWRPDVWGFAFIETACQVSIYALAFTALGVRFDLLQVLALAPVFYIADLMNFTPSGLGLREVLFAGVLDVLPDASADIGVATGLLISTMLLLATLLGGGFALLLPYGNPTAGSPRPKSTD